ncbi:MAG TPA: IS3 family transposase [Candidatus Solibacter sp.]
MPKRTFTPEQIVGKLRQMEVLISQGKTVSQAAKDAGITDQTFYRWRKEYGGLQTEQARKLKDLLKENAQLRRAVADLTVEKQVLKDIAGGKLLSPERRRVAVQHAREKGMSERRACRLANQPRGTQRYQPVARVDEGRLTEAIVELASEYGRYGYRRITALLRDRGWTVGTDRVGRIWRREGLKVPARHKPRRRLWLKDGSCIRLRPEHRNHVWSYDFVEARTHDGRSLRLLTLIDEYSRECLAIRVARRLNSFQVVETLGEAMLQHGTPEHVRSDNGAEMRAQRVRLWLDTVGTRPMFIEPGSPWENGYCESFNGKLRDECLNGEIFYSLKEARVVIEMWRKHYNTRRPHSALGYRPPAPSSWIAA